MSKETIYWITMSYAGVFDDLKVKEDSAEEKNLKTSLYFNKNEKEEAIHLKYLIQALIKANYNGAKEWYKDLPKEYQKIIPNLKIRREDLKK